MTALGAESVFFSHTILVYPEPSNIGQKPGLDATHCVKVYTQWTAAGGTLPQGSLHAEGGLFGS